MNKVANDQPHAPQLGVAYDVATGSPIGMWVSMERKLSSKSIEMFLDIQNYFLHQATNWEPVITLDEFTSKMEEAIKHFNRTARRRDGK